MTNIRENRIKVNMESNIYDGSHVFHGTVENVSRNGIKLFNIPQKFDTVSKSCVVVVSSKDKNFKFHVTPRWHKKDNYYKEIGLKIISPPLKWISFMKDLEYPMV